MSKHMAEQHYPECERHRDGSPDCCICVRLEEHGYEFIAKVRADLAHAEAVAARLVEVICEQDREWAGTEWRAMRRERDAARAEVADLIRWKEEATAVIEAWERVWRLLGEPGFISESKAEATWVEVRDLLNARSELVEARRARREAERDRDFTITMANALMVERDAARVEVAKYSAEADHWHAQLLARATEEDA